MNAQLDLHGIAAGYDGHPLIEDLSMILAPGEIGCLLGASGSGKSTLLRAIAGLHPITQGSIKLGDLLLDNGSKYLAPEKRHIGLVFQDYALFPHMTALQNIRYGATEPVDDLIELVGLENFTDRLPHQLSGGQQQRVALARALAMRPQLILMDEPFSNLDANLRDELSEQTRQIIKKSNTMALVVSHDQYEAFAIADRIGVMHQGKLLQWDTPKTLVNSPNSIEVANFIGQALIAETQVIQGVAHSAYGEFNTAVDDGYYWLIIRPTQVNLNGTDLSVTINERRTTPAGIRLRVESAQGEINFDLHSPPKTDKLVFSLKGEPCLIKKF